MPLEFDLDAVDAAAEETGPKPVRFKGEVFQLPATLPYFALREAFASPESDIAFLEVVFGEQFPRFKELAPSSTQVDKLTDWILEVYGFRRGKSPSSPDSSDSSPSDGNGSRPTSPGTTASTSGELTTSEYEG
jgi:hypothetical protein